MKMVLRFLVLVIMLVLPTLFLGCGPSGATSDSVPAEDIDTEEADANPSDDQ